MSAMQVAQRMTADQFLVLPEPELGRPWNLVDGEVVVNDPTARHGDVVGNLQFALESWSRAEQGRGGVAVPRNVRLDPSNVFSPDILWYAEGRVPPSDSPPPYAMPDLAVEVRSPSTWRYDVGAKKSGYEANGLPELWLVDTEGETVMAFRRSRAESPRFDQAAEFGTGDTLTSPLLPDFTASIDEVFAKR